MKYIKFLPLVVLGSFALSSAVFACEPAPTATPVVVAQTVSTDVASVELRAFNLVNEYRVSQGLPALVRVTTADTQARQHSANMANGSVGFGHTGFSTRVANSGISYSSAGENVAYNQGYSDPAKQAVDGWLKSPGHLANIRNASFNKTGFGVAKSSNGAYYFTQLFFAAK